MGKLACQNFGPFGGAFACGYNSFLRTRFDALTRHIFHSPAERTTQKHRTRDNQS